MIRSMMRYLPGLALIGLAAVIFSRKGYGPFGDNARRADACTVSRCAHNATLALAAGTFLLVKATRAASGVEDRTGEPASYR
jgi:hypothetical protein